MSENIAHNIDDTRTKDVIIEGNVSFQSMYLPEKILEGLTKCGYQKPSPIQVKAIPLGRCGFDLIVKSKSGTGKTLVFSVVALEMLDLSSLDLQVLMLAPTREIAVQIADTIKTIGTAFTGLNVNYFIGGFPEKDDIAKAQNCQIAVGAPGRVKSLIKQNVLNVSNVKLFVLDEADKLMEESFQADVNEIYKSLAQKKQIIAVSATYPDNLQDFLSQYMQSPTYVSAENNTELLLGLRHFIKEVKLGNSSQITQCKNEELLKLLSSVSFTQCLIFTNFQTRAETVSIYVNSNGWHSNSISAAQSQEKRLEAINQLKNFKCRILFSTDLTARGIDASNVDLVINYDVPKDVSTYLHRMGRAGRFGSKGICVTLTAGENDLLQMRKFLGYIGGAELTISKINDGDIGPNELWKCDESKFEQISGLIEENADVTRTIKNEILSMKKNSFVADENTTKTKKTKSKCEKKTTLPDTIEKNDSTTKNINEKAANITEKENIYCIEDVANKTCLQSLLDGTYDFENIHCPERFSGNIDEFPSENDTIVKAITEIEDQFVKSSTSGCINEFNSGNNSVFGCKNKDEKTRKSSELEVENEGKICKNEVYIKNKGVYEIARMLNTNDKSNSDEESNLTNYLNIIDDRTEDNELEQTSENIVQQHPEPEKNRQDIGNIFSHAYRYTMELQDNHWKNILKDDERQAVNKNVVQNMEKDIDEDEYMEEDYEEEYMEDYEGDYEGLEKEGYVDQIEEDYLDQIEEGYLDQIEEGYYGEEEGFEDLAEGYDEEMTEACSEVKYDENGYINIPNRMVWVPVEQNTSENSKNKPRINLLEDDDNTYENATNEAIIDPSPTTSKCIGNQSSVPPVKEPQVDVNGYQFDHFSACFHEYSNELWQQGLKFNTVEEFDNWYYSEWLEGIKKVREYVRQNVYVKEMSKYQNIKGKFRK